MADREQKYRESEKGLLASNSQPQNGSRQQAPPRTSPSFLKQAAREGTLATRHGRKGGALYTPGEALPVRLQQHRLKLGPPREVLPVVRLLSAGLLRRGRQAQDGAILGPKRGAAGGGTARGRRQAVSLSSGGP